MVVSEYFRSDSQFYGDGYRQWSRHYGDQSNARWNYRCRSTNGSRYRRGLAPSPSVASSHT